MFSPFVKDSDDQLSQMAQLQVFLTLLSSLALRATPPSVLVGNMVTVILFAVPMFSVVLQSPVLKHAMRLWPTLKIRLAKLFPRFKRPEFLSLSSDPTANSSPVRPNAPTWDQSDPAVQA